MKLTNDKEYEEIIEKHNFIVVQFYANWCAPCRTIRAKVLKYLEENENAPYLLVNVESNRRLVKDYEVSKIPTCIIYENGVEIKRFVEYFNIQDVFDIMHEHGF